MRRARLKAHLCSLLSVALLVASCQYLSHFPLPRGDAAVAAHCDAEIPSAHAADAQGALGMTDIPRVQIPYPVAGTDEETQRELAEQVAPQILDALMGRQAADAGHC